MKKLFALMFVFLMLLSFAACSFGNGGGDEKEPSAEDYFVVEGEDLAAVEEFFEDWLSEAAWQTYKATISGYYGTGTLYHKDIAEQEALSCVLTTAYEKQEVYIKDGTVYRIITPLGGEPESESEPYRENVNLLRAQIFMLKHIKTTPQEVWDYDTLVVSSTAASGQRYIKLEYSWSYYDCTAIIKISAANKTESVRFFMCWGENSQGEQQTLEQIMEPYSGAISFPAGLPEPEPQGGYTLVEGSARAGVLDNFLEETESALWQRFSGGISTSGMDVSMSGTIYADSENKALAWEMTGTADGIGDITHEQYVKDGFFYENDNGLKKSINYYPNEAVVFVIDSSGSMGPEYPDINGTIKMPIVKDAVKNALDFLSDSDYVGIVTFDTYAEVMIGLTSAPQKTLFGTAIDNIIPLGGTNYAAGINMACDLLIMFDKEVTTKRIIMITDGWPQDAPNGPWGYMTAAQKCKDNDIAISMITLLDAAEGNPNIATGITELTGGRAYDVENAYDISIFLETELVNNKTKALISNEQELTSLIGVLSPFIAGEIEDALVYVTAQTGERKIKLCNDFENESSEIILTVDENNRVTKIEAAYSDSDSDSGITKTLELTPFGGLIPFPDDLNPANYPPLK